MTAPAKPLFNNNTSNRKEALPPGGLSGNPNSNTNSRSPLNSPRSMSPLRSLTIPSAPPLPDPDLHEAILRSTNPLQKSFSMDHGTRNDLRVQKILAKVSSESGTSSTSHRRDLRRVSIDENDIDPQFEAQAEAGPEPEPAPRSGSRPRSRSKSEASNGKRTPRNKSPYSRLRSSDFPMENDSPSGYHTRSSRNTEAVAAAVDISVTEPERGRSPRRSRASSSTAMAMVSPVPEEAAVTRKSGRSTSRRRRVAEPPHDTEVDTDLGMGDAHTPTKQVNGRSRSRPHRRKASEPPVVVAQDAALSLPENMNYGNEIQVPALHHQLQKVSSPSKQNQQIHSPTQLRAASYSFRVPSSFSPSSSRRTSREFRTIQTSNWMQYIEDIVMWRHIPRSSLLFGAGCFFIMSASVVQDMHYSVISFMAYIALFYLGATYIKRSFLRSNTAPESMPDIYMVTEAEALRIIRVLLPPINLMLHKIGDLFCGEPVVTLKVASALWILAKAGSMMNAWTFTRIAYFAIFTVPKCYASYNNQVQIQVQKGLKFVQNLWATCRHKKAFLCAGLVLAWNVSSVSTRVCGAFMALVALRAYQHVLRSELQLSNVFLNANHLLATTCAVEANPNSFQVGAEGYQLGIPQPTMVS